MFDFKTGDVLLVVWGASVGSKVDSVVSLFSTPVLTLGTGVGVIEGDGEADSETVAEGVAVEVSTDLFVLVADQGKILVTVIITTVIKAVILADMT